MHQFQVGNLYTAGEIAATVGGDVNSSFPLADGRTVALRLRPDIHRDAPDLVHVDGSPVHVHGVEHLVTAQEAIPVFMKDARRNLFAYLGSFFPRALDRDPDLCAREGDRIGRKVAGMLELVRVE